MTINDLGARGKNVGHFQSMQGLIQKIGAGGPTRSEGTSPVHELQHVLNCPEVLDKQAKVALDNLVYYMNTNTRSCPPAISKSTCTMRS